MRVLLLSTLLLINANLSAQTTLSGTVYLYKEKGNNTPLEGVNIKAPSGGSQMTEKNGTYSFAFDNQVSVITLQARKMGYEVINEEEIKALELAKKRQQHIYFDVEGNTRKRERELLDAALAQRSKLRDSYYAILEKGGKEADLLKLKLEKEAGKSFKDFDELKSYIYEKYGADSKTLESIIPSIVRMNLDHSNKEVEKMKKYVLKGMVDSVVMLLDLRQRYTHVENRINSIAVLQAKNDLDKQIIKASIPGLLLDGRYAAIDSCYELIIKIDTTDLGAYFEYARFLQSQNKLIKARDYYNLVLKKYRLLAVTPQEVYERDIAKTLNNLGSLLRDFGDYQEARQHYREALEIYKRLAVQNPQAYLPGIAGILNNLGNLLQNMEDYSEARQHYQEALQIRKRLAVQTRQLYQPDMAQTLYSLGFFFNKIRDYPAARQHYQEALEIYRHLATQNPQEYESDLANTLNSLGNLLNDGIKEYTEARQHYQEALQIRRRQTAQNPQAYEPDVAGTLVNLGTLLKNVKDYTEAQQHYQEALRIYRRLTTQNPQVYEPDLATLLNNLGILFQDIKDYTEARQHYQEALQIRRRLAAQNLQAYEPDVAATLNNLGILLKNTKDYPEARQYYQDALQIYRRLATQSPQAYEPNLAMTLYNLGNLLQNIQNYQSARQHYEEALQIRRRLATQNPQAYETDVASTLNNLGNLLQNIQNYQSARQHYQEALQIYRRLAIQNAQLYEPDLAMTLYNLGISLKNIGDHQEARLHYQEALEIYRRLAAQSPQAYEPNIANTLYNLADLLQSADSVAAAKSYRELLDLQLLQRQTTENPLSAIVNIHTTADKLGDIYNKSCVKDSAFYYYALTLAYSDSVILQLQTALATDKNNATLQYYYGIYNGSASWYALHTRKYKEAVQYAQHTLETDSTQHWVNTNLAHGLLLSGNYVEAEVVYKALKNRIYEQDSTKNYAQVLLEDLKSLECSGAIPKEREADVERIKAMLGRGD